MKCTCRTALFTTVLSMTNGCIIQHWLLEQMHDVQAACHITDHRPTVEQWLHKRQTWMRVKRDSDVQYSRPVSMVHEHGR